MAQAERASPATGEARHIIDPDKGSDVPSVQRTYGGALFPQHQRLLRESAINGDVAAARGYVSVDTKTRLKPVGITPVGRNVPGLLIPMHRAEGSVWGYQYRPDAPRRTPAGKAVKYETPRGQANHIDIPPGIREQLGDPAVPLLVTEGSRKADSAVSAGLACVALIGVWGWRGTNGQGGKTAVSDWHDITLAGRRAVLAFDSDVIRKREVQAALRELGAYLDSKGARVEYLHLPDDDDAKTGLDDFIAANGAEAIWPLVRPDLPVAGSIVRAADFALAGRQKPAKTSAGAQPQDFFDPRDGLKAATLTREIEKLGPVAAGNGGQLYQYAGGVWRPDGERVIRARTAGLLDELYRMAYASTSIDILRSREPVLSDAGLDERYLNLPNGLLDWRTGALTGHDPAVRSVTRIPVEWDPGAECPEISKWLDGVLPADARSFAEELIGYTLYNGNPLHKAVILFGRGRNGKGTFLRLLRELAGAENCCSVSPQSLDENRFMAAELYGKIANLVGDVDPRTFKATEIFKKITGDDEITAERKHGQPFQFRARSLLIAGFNALPRTSDTSTGFFSRWIVVPFARYFPDDVADKSLFARLAEPSEMRGLLVLAVAGLRRLMQRGYFELPASVKKATTAFRYSADPVRAWMTECTTANHDGWLTRKALYEAFSEWCAANGHRPMGSGTFHERLTAASQDVFGYPVAARKRAGERGFAGIGWQSANNTADPADDDAEDAEPYPQTGGNQDNQAESDAPAGAEGAEGAGLPLFYHVRARAEVEETAPSAPSAPTGGRPSGLRTIGCPACGQPARTIVEPGERAYCAACDNEYDAP